MVKILTLIINLIKDKIFTLASSMVHPQTLNYLNNIIEQLKT